MVQHLYSSCNNIIVMGPIKSTVLSVVTDYNILIHITIMLVSKIYHFNF